MYACENNVIKQQDQRQQFSRPKVAGRLLSKTFQSRLSSEEDSCRVVTEELKEDISSAPTRNAIKRENNHARECETET